MCSPALLAVFLSAILTAKSTVLRKYDVVVFGSTGFTGSLVAEYFAKNNPTGLKWAVAGRNEKKLNTLKEKLRLDESVDVLVANTDDQESLDLMAKQTKVILSTAGPFALIGTPVIDACIRCDTHYCDTTGEAQWIRTIIDTYNDEAIEKKLKIVNCCGFDCIPSDLGTLMMVEKMKNLNLKPIEIRYICRDTKSGASGGTIASVMNIYESSTSEMIEEGSNPFFLNPRDVRTNIPIQTKNSNVYKANQDTNGIIYDEIEGKWMMPWIMQAIDTRIVNRSNALFGWKYGQNLIYRELMTAPNLFTAILSSIIGAFVGPLLSFRFTRNIIKPFLMKQGEGPTQDILDTGFMKIGFWGRGTNNLGEENIVKGMYNTLRKYSCANVFIYLPISVHI